MALDNLCKYLAETYPDDFAKWLLNEPLADVKVLKTELNIEPIRADSVTFLRGQNRILHLEFQIEPTSEPALPLRMLDYWVRLYRQHNQNVTQILLILKETGVEIPNTFQAEFTRHEYKVIKMWEQEAEPLLQNQHLLPLATLAKTDDKHSLLHNIAERIKQIENVQTRGNLLAQTNFFAGLRFDKKLINLLLKENFMRESVTYQEVLQEGREEGILQGLEEAKKREVKLIVKMLEKQLGEKIGLPIRRKIAQLSFQNLEKLGLALFDLNSPEDLKKWLAQK